MRSRLPGTTGDRGYVYLPRFATLKKRSDHACAILQHHAPMGYMQNNRAGGVHGIELLIIDLTST
eukprot:SAG31_NODE_1597_length_7799_cov_37.912857_9_plen_65_part_00